MFGAFEKFTFIQKEEVIININARWSETTTTHNIIIKKNLKLHTIWLCMFINLNKFVFLCKPRNPNKNDIKHVWKLNTLQLRQKSHFFIWFRTYWWDYWFLSTLKVFFLKIFFYLVDLSFSCGLLIAGALKKWMIEYQSVSNNSLATHSSGPTKQRNFVFNQKKSWRNSSIISNLCWRIFLCSPLIKMSTRRLWFGNFSTWYWTFAGHVNNKRINLLIQTVLFHR